MASIKEKIVSGVFWRMLESIGVQGVNLLITIVLSRLLSPKDFGVVALVAVFISISEIVIRGGFETALVQKRDADSVDYNSVFYTSFFLSLVVYGLLYITAPSVATFFKEPLLVDLLRFVSLPLLFHALSIVPNAILLREMMFDRSFKINLLQAIFSGAIGVSLAYQGFGAWALAISSVSGTVIGTVLRFWFIKWYPQASFSFSSISALFSFSSKLVLTNLSRTLFSNLYSVIIGRFYSAADLSIYNKGRMLPQLLVNIVNQVVGAVASPALMHLQEDNGKYRRLLQLMIQSSYFIVLPTMTLLAICSESVVLLLFGDQWVESVPFMRIACVAFVIEPLQTLNLSTITIKGRSDICLFVEVMSKIVLVVALALCYNKGLIAIAMVTAFVIVPISTLITTWPNGRISHYSFFSQMRDISSSVAISVIMGVVTCPLLLIQTNHFVKIILIGVVGMLSYLGMNYLFRVPIFFFLLDTLMSNLLKKFGRRLSSGVR